MQKEQFEPYKKELKFAVVAVLTSILLVGYSYSSNGNTFEYYEKLNGQRSGLKVEVDGLVEARDLLADIGTQFENIKVQGFYGDEDRLSWVEVLKVVSDRLKLPNLKYSISPQEKILKISDNSVPGFFLSQSIMSIEADLLHEGDMLDISEALSMQPGLFRLQGCELNKGESSSVYKNKKNMTLKCSLAWHTVEYNPDEIVEEEVIDLGTETEM